MRRFHKARDRIARAGAREAQQALATGGDSLANAGQAIGIGGEHAVSLVQIGADHADAVIVLRVAVVKVCLRRLDAGVQIELVAHLEGVAAKALKGTVLEGPDHGNGFARELGLIAVGPAKTVLMLGKAERHDAQAGDLLMFLAVAQGLFQLLAVVHAGAQHDLRVNLDAGCHDGLEHVQAALGVAAHHTAADIGAHGVDRHVHRTHVAVDDVLHVLVGKVRERDKVALQKAQAIVVVADIERGATALGQHGHKAEYAGVDTGTHAVKDGAIELKAPILAGKAIELHGGDGAVARVENLQLDGVFVGLPEPHDHVGELLTVDREHAHARLDTHIPCGRFGTHVLNERALTRLGVAAAPVIGHLGGVCGYGLVHG